MGGSSVCLLQGEAKKDGLTEAERGERTRDARSNKPQASDSVDMHQPVYLHQLALTPPHVSSPFTTPLPPLPAMRPSPSLCSKASKFQLISKHANKDYYKGPCPSTSSCSPCLPSSI